MLVLGISPKAKERVPLITRHTIKESRQRFRLILAEDNIINQKVAVHILENYGHKVTVANNGQEVLSSLKKEHFDLILMDVQMPEMDGFEATASIREKEKRTGFYIPIIAMTAHAMKGDRERCLDSGMDDYIAKPLKAEHLTKTIDRVMSKVKKAKKISIKSQIRNKMAEEQYPNQDIPPIDFASALERVEGDKSFLEELLNLYFEDFSEKYGQLQKAIEQKNFNLIRELGHNLKGSSANLSLTFLQETSSHMEVAGRDRNGEKAKKALALLEQEFKRLKDFLSKKNDKFANRNK
jgi:CheY-like chemotaxis protein